MLICSRCPVLVRSFRGCGVNILSSNPTLIRFNENSQHVSHLTVELVFVVVAVARLWFFSQRVVALAVEPHPETGLATFSEPEARTHTHSL